jgi:hypothetical protein
MKRNINEEVIPMSPEERRIAIAGILAAGVLRLHARAALGAALNTGSGAEIPEDFSRNGLELGGDSRLSVHTG